VLCMMSISIGFFNLLPFPLLDGGQITAYTIEAVLGPISTTASSITTYGIILLALIFLLYVSYKDITALRH
jgi:regulator of sigma E protease